MSIQSSGGAGGANLISGAQGLGNKGKTSGDRSGAAQGADDFSAVLTSVESGTNSIEVKDSNVAKDARTAAKPPKRASATKAKDPNDAGESVGQAREVAGATPTDTSNATSGQGENGLRGASDAAGVANAVPAMSAAIVEKVLMADSQSSVESEIDLSATLTKMAMTALPTQDKPSEALDPSASSVSGLPFDMTMLLAQASQVAAVQSAALADGNPIGLVVKNDLNPAAVLAGGAKLLPIAPEGGAPQAEAGENFNQVVKGELEQSALVQPSTDAARKSGAEVLSTAAANQADTRALRQVAMTGTMAREPLLISALASRGGEDSPLRQFPRVDGKPFPGGTAVGVEGAWGHQALLASHRFEAQATVVANSLTPPMETLVADKVSYWVAQGIQSAQLKLDGFGGEAVQVSISLKGDVAHIGFRTDQAEVRQMLQGAALSLKELLTGEGLILSGVSVSSSGQGGAGSGEHSGRQGSRQAMVAAGDSAQKEPRQRNAALGAGSVDLFV